MMKRNLRFQLGISLISVSTFMVSACAPTAMEPPPDSFVVLANSAQVTPKKGEDFEIVSRKFDNLGDYREARIVWWIQPIGNKSQANGNSSPVVTVEVKVADGKETTPHFSKRLPFGFDASNGANVRFNPSPQTISLIGRSESAEPLEISVAANFRKTSILNLGLNQKDLESFDKRYCDLQNNMGGLEEVYEVGSIDQVDQESTGGLFAFDYLNELRDLFAPDCSITISDGTEECNDSPEELTRNIGRAHFMLPSRIETTEGPSFEVTSNQAFIRAGRKLYGKKRMGIGERETDIFKWQEEMKIELRDGRLAITELKRIMEPQEPKSK